MNSKSILIMEGQREQVMFELENVEKSKTYAKQLLISPVSVTEQALHSLDKGYLSPEQVAIST